MLRNQIVLVSGASGFVATHVLDAFLSAGYSYGVKLIFAIISGIGKPNAFDDAVKGVDSIIHTASPAQFRVDDNERDLLARQSMAPITSSISFKSTHRV
ncbi:NAD dependent epimerase/dehydratase [Penicillium rubens]|nr:NAD dependent epimerase/dehydratase [Penicillium rubens]